jgi:uncharacterized protein YmfQ (DUF2313 family)
MANSDELQRDYETLMHQLLPRGPAWSDADPLLLGLAPELARLHSRSDDLMMEVNPATTTELIDRYEALCGLPDECIPEGVQTLPQRQRRLDAKINVAGGINLAFYRETLDRLGYENISIRQYQDESETPNPEWGDLWRFYWEVTIPLDSTVEWMNCSNACNSAIRMWGDTVAECVLDKLKPSHTILNYVYPDGSYTDASNQYANRAAG